MARAGHLQRSRAKVHVAKLCMDSKQDREAYEKIANDPTCKILEKTPNSTPKGVVWLTVFYEKP